MYALIIIIPLAEQRRYRHAAWRHLSNCWKIQNIGRVQGSSQSAAHYRI